MFRFAYANQNRAMNASAAQAEAASCCASRTSSFSSSFSRMSIKMGAIAMASILAFMPVLRGMILPALVLSITLIILLYTVFPYTEQVFQIVHGNHLTESYFFLNDSLYHKNRAAQPNYSGSGC